jgi:hypothetical protein
MMVLTKYIHLHLQEHLQEQHKIMAHFAEIDENNIVKRVLVVDNSLEHRGEDFLANELGLGGRWIQTSYNNNFRKQYAGVGFRYDEVRDEFVTPQPFPSWILDENNDWQPPVPQTDETTYWDEETLSWKPLFE